MKKRIHKKVEQHPLSRIPHEKKRELNQTLHDHKVISVYTDCSANDSHLGISACFVGRGEIKVRSSKIDIPYQSATIYGELQAILFAIEYLPIHLEKFSRLIDKPDTAIIYTDAVHVQSIPEGVKGDTGLLLSQIANALSRFNETYKCNLSIMYLGEAKKNHLHHRIAHSAARNILKR